MFLCKRSRLKKVLRFSLTLLLSVAMVVQFTQMASASQSIPQGCFDHCDHTISIDDETFIITTENASDHHGAHDEDCAMMACSGLIAVQAVPPSSMHDLSAAKYANAFRTESDGPILPQLGKPPKHI
jgi:hypothetical protein